MSIILKKRNRKLLIGIFLFELFLVSVPLYEAINSRKVSINQTLIQSGNIARLVNLEVETFFYQVVLELKDREALIHKEGIFEGKLRLDSSELKQVRSNRRPGLLGVGIYDLKGALLNSRASYVGQFPSKKLDLSLFQDGLDKTDYFITKPYACAPNHRCLSVVRRLFDNTKSHIGFIAGTIDLGYFYNIFQSVNVGTKGFIAFTDRNNSVYIRFPKMDKSFDTSLKNQGEEYISTFVKCFGNRFEINISFSKKEALLHSNDRMYIEVIVLGISNIVFFIFLGVILYSFDQLEGREKQAVQLSKLASLGEMSAAIAHEINNPLTVISGQIQLLQKVLSKEMFDDEKVKKSYEKINKNVARIVKIIMGLKSYARDSSNDPFQSTSILKIIKYAVEISQERIRSARVEVRVIPFNDLKIDCKEVQIEQVLVNLINNACDAVSDFENKWIQIEVVDKGYEVHIRFIDSGTGISEEIADQIMEPFFTTKDIGKGTGLGLSVSQRIINNHHGQLTFDRECNNTCFVISLPKYIDFDEAIIIHVAWKKKLRKYIRRPDRSLDDELISRDDCCELGRWIYGNGNIYSSMKEYEQLKTRHAKFHSIAGKIVAQANQFKEKLDEDKLLGLGSDYARESEQVVEVLLLMKKKHRQRFDIE